MTARTTTTWALSAEHPDVLRVDDVPYLMTVRLAGMMKNSGEPHLLDFTPCRESARGCGRCGPYDEHTIRATSLDDAVERGALVKLELCAYAPHGRGFLMPGETVEPEHDHAACEVPA